jgi:hypothetical protein
VASEKPEPRTKTDLGNFSANDSFSDAAIAAKRGVGGQQPSALQAILNRFGSKAVFDAILHNFVHCLRRGFFGNI